MKYLLFSLFAFLLVILSTGFNVVRGDFGYGTTPSTAAGDRLLASNLTSAGEDETDADFPGSTCTISIISVSVTDESCPGVNDGTLTINAACSSCNDGDTDIRYSIDNTDFSNTTGIFTGLAPGDYTVYVRDINDISCTSSDGPHTIDGNTDTEAPIPDITSGDGWAEAAKALASDGAASDDFGYSVSISGDYAIVGANADNDNGSFSGSAYIFHRSGSSWSEQAKLTASDGAESDFFGSSVSLSGDYAIVGAYQDSDNGASSGSAYIFHRSGSSWSEQAKLTASDGAASDNFGYSVSLSGDYAIVGAYQDDDNGDASGSAYIFHRSGSSWSEQAKMTALDGAASDNFGYSVSISGDYAIVGAYQDDDNGDASGSAYIFHRSGSSWSEQAKLTASDGVALDNFGESVSVSGDYVIVGVWRDDDNGLSSGSAYIFHRSGSSWSEQAKLTASDGVALDNFGYSVSISGDYAIVGAYQDDDNGDASGSAYIFHRSGSSWSEQAKVTASDGGASDNFGESVSISGNYAIVGARVNEANVNGFGSAYLFEFEPALLPAFTVGCNATPPAPSATDNCAGTITGTTTATFPITTPGTTTITWTYDDGNGNITAQNQDIVIEDSTPPSAVCPVIADLAIDASGVATLPANIGTGLSSDNCSTPTETSPELTFGCADIGTPQTVPLTATDADGNSSTASCMVNIVDTEAPVPDISTGGGWNEAAKALAGDGVADDGFGCSVSISGDYAIVGAVGNDENGDGSGSVYIFHRSGNSWVQQAKLTASDGAAGDYFGESVSLSGDYAIVGAFGDADNGGTSGSAYIFHRSGSSWSEQAKLTASDGTGLDYFGRAVSLSGDYAIVGAQFDDDNGISSGSAYIFHRSGSSWSEQAKLTASDGAASDFFGWSVSVDGDYAIVGAWQDDDDGDSSGSAYIFHRSGSSWLEQAKLTASDGTASDSFGFSVSVSGDYAIVGADGADDNGNSSGSVYVFHRAGSSWTQQAKLTASDGAADDNFGESVSLSGDYAIVGALFDADNGVFSGSAYIFHRSGNSWVEQAKLTASDGSAGDNFSGSVSLSGDYAIVGAELDDDSGISSGSSYLFELEPGFLPAFTAECSSATPPTPTATDNCAGSITGMTTATFPITTPGTTTITWTYDDGNGNSIIQNQDIIVSDAEAPVAICPTTPPTVVLDANGNGILVTNALAGGSSTDNCSVTETSAQTSFSCLDAPTATVVLTATDVVGNSSTANCTVNIVDTEAPVPDITSGSGWAEAAKALAGDGAAGDDFGHSVSVSGDYAIVGARSDGDNGGNSGSAYIFHRTGNSWVQQAKLTASDGVQSDNFGTSVSISGGYAIVGAVFDDDNGSESGSAYIFHRSGSSWTEQAKLTASDGAASDYFGSAVSLSGDYAIVGARFDDDNGSESGSAYIFHLSGSSWTEQAKLTASDGAGSDWFGWSVSLSGDYAIVGSWQDDDDGDRSGSAYIFHRTGGSWSEQVKLTASDGAALDNFGFSVSLSGDYAIVGADGDADNGASSGSAYIFHRSGSSWTEQAKLTASDGAVNDRFGHSVSLSGDYVIVGAYEDDDDGSSSGSAYIFQRSGSSWSEQTKLTASDGEADDNFGEFVSLSGNYATVGARLDDDNGDASGSSYFFQFEPALLPAFTGECSAIPPAPTATDNCAATIMGTTTATFPITAPGITTVTWTYDDGSGNITTQNQDIVVSDTEAPVAVCPTTPPTVMLDASGTGTLAANALAGGNSTDNCSAMETSAETSFSCFGTPPSTVVLTATDAAGNSSTANCTVNIIDAESPVAICPDIPPTIMLDANGTGTLTANALAGGNSTDNCSLAETSAETSFSCLDGPTVTVLLTATDAAGNSSTANCTVNIMDLEDPIPDITSGYSWTEAAKALASDGAANDRLGWSVSISGDYAIVGARYDDDNGSDSGSAYIFHRNGGSWVQQAKLTASDGAADDEFGWSVSISGDYAIVGAKNDADNGSFSGSAYIFYRNGSSWTEQTKLTASDGAGFDNFGYSVSVNGDYAIVGAERDDDNGLNSGSAYIFQRNGSSWTEQDKLTASDGAADDLFGYSVSVSGDYVIVGAYQDDDNGSDSGSAYIFHRSGNSWTEQAKLTASDGAADDEFGASVSINGDYAFVGARHDDDNGSSSGSAYIFNRSANSWSEQTKLTASDGATLDYFGESVTLSGDYAIVGAWRNSAAYIFQRSGNSWSELIKLTASDAAQFNSFGWSVSISEGFAIVGAQSDNDNGDASGSAYLFELKPEPLTAFSAGCSADPPAPTATDNCAGTITGTTTTIFPITTPGTTTITWTYDDGNGNISTQDQDIVIEDTTPPVAVCPTIADIAIDANGVATLPANIGMGLSTDHCSIPTETSPELTFGCADIGTIQMVTLTADDDNDNTATVQCSFQVTDPNSNCATDGECSPDPLTLDDDPVATGIYRSTSTIMSAGRVAASTNVVFTAGQTITLQPGFTAEAGSSFTARIEDCDPPTVSTLEKELTDTGGEATEGVDYIMDARPESVQWPGADRVNVFPNPFRNQANISLEISEDKQVGIRLFSLTGQLVHTVLESSMHPAGENQLVLDGNRLTPGVYILAVRIGNQIYNRRLVVLR